MAGTSRSNPTGRVGVEHSVVPTPLGFAARSVTPNSTGEFEWRITTAQSGDWFAGDQIVQDEFGSGFIFGGPVNGFQNAQLDVGGGQTVWIKVHDFDRDGNWQVGNRESEDHFRKRPARQPDEGESVQLTIEFFDDPEGHVLQVDWGDGSAPTLVPVRRTADARRSSSCTRTWMIIR